jgi:hypothetical protein
MDTDRHLGLGAPQDTANDFVEGEELGRSRNWD